MENRESDNKNLENKASGDWESEYAGEIADGGHKRRADATQKRLRWNN